jgi:hypothetical protein
MVEWMVVQLVALTAVSWVVPKADYWVVTKAGPKVVQMGHSMADLMVVRKAVKRVVKMAA